MCSEVQNEILERKGIYIPMTRVVMTSDETDEAWWDEVTALGWARMDHDEQRTVERFGRWYVLRIHHCEGFTDYMRVSGTRSSSMLRSSRVVWVSWARTAPHFLCCLADEF